MSRKLKYTIQGFQEIGLKMSVDIHPGSAIGCEAFDLDLLWELYIYRTGGVESRGMQEPSYSGGMPVVVSTSGGDETRPIVDVSRDFLVVEESVGCELTLTLFYVMVAAKRGVRYPKGLVGD